MICFFMLFVVFRLLDYGNRPCLCQTVRTSSARRDGVVLCDTDVGRDPQADGEVAVGNIHFDGERAVERTCRVVGEFRYVASLHVIDGLDRLLRDGEGLRLRAVGLMPCQAVCRVFEQEERCGRTLSAEAAFRIEDGARSDVFDRNGHQPIVVVIETFDVSMAVVVAP